MVRENESQITKTGTLPITVNKDVVKHLSIGLYRNFALSVKELISNAYDAGATEVKIKLDLKNNKIIIRDNGRGMNYNEFKDEYLRIGFSKEPAKTTDELGRMRIGVFGIGFLAPLPYCKLMHIITKKKGSDKALEAAINAENFFKKGSWDIKEEEVPYKEYKSDLPKAEGETIIILEDIKPQIAEDLARKELMGKSKIDQFGGFEKFKWTICQYAPIQFPPDRKDLREFLDEPNRVSMRLWIDGEELFRNVPKGVRILEKNEKKFGDISVKYVIMSPYKPIRPAESRGLQVRLRDVAIGLPRDFDVTKIGRVLGKLNFICGEVHIVEGLDNALMVNRDNFNYTQEVSDMFKFFQARLRKWNDTLYDWIEEDRRVYDALGELKEDDKIVEGLKESEIIHFDKERLRLQKSPIVKTKKTELEKPLKKVIKVISEAKKKEFKVVTKKGRVQAAQRPIKISSKKKLIEIYEEHPAFVEKLKVGKKEFKVEYEEWDPDKTSYSICKLHDKGSKVSFNTSHPLFKSKLSDEVIKRLSLGIVLTLKDSPKKEDIIKKLNQLLEDVFLER
jgi:hypothetical protein